jgi:pimeloyl-ACP methyl ester carboxylesterase
MSTLSLFLHSTGTTPAMWSGVPDEVVAGTRKLTPSHLGYPPNPPLARGESGGAAADARHVLGTIPEDAGAIHLHAHSYGGLVALALIPALRGRVRSLFLYEPVLFGALAHDPLADPEVAAEARAFIAHPWFATDVEKGGTEPWLEMFIDYWNRPGSWARMPEEQRDEIRRLGWKMFQEVRACFFENQSFSALPIDGVPCTVVRGERSPRASREMAAAVARAHPHVRLVDLPKTGHMAPLTHPALVHEALIEHARRIRGG